jgi:TldD protein
MPSHLQTTDKLFYEKNDLDPRATEKTVNAALAGADDGELYLEYSQSEDMLWTDGKLKSATQRGRKGFGLRAISGEICGFAHAPELSEKALARAAETVKAARSGQAGKMDLAPPGTNQSFYGEDNPLDELPFPQKVKFLEEVDAYARGKDLRVKQVSVNLACNWKAVQILRAGGHKTADIRPIVRFFVSVMLDDGKGRMEVGAYGTGGRHGYGPFLDEKMWKTAADEALRRANVSMSAVESPAGEMNVVLAAGIPGILLHEAVGHGLEGDSNRKKTSAFAGLMGKRVASKGVTIVDDGTFHGASGSLTMDDEGTPAQRNVLIEDGVLVGYMQDRMNARLMGLKPTGNGRRQSFSNVVLPRMTNTFMLAGQDVPEDIIKSVDRGIYCVSFDSGQVNTTTGKFVFSANEAYLIENGRIGPAVRGATLIGNGPDALTKVRMIGTDLKLDPGAGMCGKRGQSVPVGLGQPTLRIDGLTVGGTQT